MCKQLLFERIFFSVLYKRRMTFSLQQHVHCSPEAVKWTPINIFYPLVRAAEAIKPDVEEVTPLFHSYLISSTCAHRI